LLESDVYVKTINADEHTHAHTQTRNLKLVVADTSIARTSLSGKNADFWLLGGASIFALIILLIGGYFKDSSIAVEKEMDGLMVSFSFLSIVCNNPHFILSYKFAYSRGFQFIREKWLQLLFVPCFLIGLFVFAYFGFEKTIDEFLPVTYLNSLFEKLGIPFDVAQIPDVGQAFMSLGVWGMFLSVGWHYSKQVFGSMLVYSRYDSYPLSTSQRLALKICLFSVAFANFFAISSQIKNGYFFLGQQLHFIVLPHFIVGFATVFSILALVYISYSIFYFNYKNFRKRPSLNFLVPLLAFYLWWFPWFVNPLFYLIMVPFFHSLQYLPFAHRMLDKSATPTSKQMLKYALQIFFVVIIGFLVFDAIPTKLDEIYKTQFHFGCSYFLIAAIVFLNIHHFFVDNVIWKFDQKEVRYALFKGE